MLKLATLAGHWGRLAPAAAGGAVYSYAWQFGTNDVDKTEKFDHSAGTWGASTTLTLTDYGTFYPTCVVGSATHGYIKSTNSTAGATSSVKFRYSDDSNQTGLTFTTHRGAAAGVQSSTVGYYMGGRRFMTTAATDVQKVTFATDALSAGSALGTGRHFAGAAGTASVGICAGGSNSDSTFAAITSTEKYTYSGDVRTAGTALGTARGSMGAAGNATFGIFALGQDVTYASGTEIATSEKYTYSSDARAAGSTFTTPRGGCAGAGDNTFGLFIGDTSSNQVAQKYTYSGDTVSTAASLTNYYKWPSMMCTTPGGL